MKAILQRVTESHVTVESKVIGKTGFGILVLLGVSKEDNESDADFLIQKTVQLRMFDDPQGKMNLSALDVKADILVVSQFTIYGDCRKGRRPSFDQAADPQTAEHLYEYYVKGLREQGLKVETGQFRAMMQVSLVNDGPVTFILDTN